MIQELLSGAGATLIAGERNYSSSTINGGGGGALLQTTHSPNSSTTTITTTSSPTTATATSSENQQNLRCPRCDSSNTKFCYYNNYNLTQPRHFCKTCRRYWTKGGALRNVPIGGGCRKNKNFCVSSSSSAGKTSSTKLKTVAIASSEFSNARSGISLGHGHGFDVEHVLPPPPTQILWGSPQNSHLLTLLRSSQNQNQSPNPNLKEEGNLMGSQSQPNMMTEPPLLNHRTPSSYDGVGHVICNSFWRNNQDQHQHQPQQQNGGFLLGEQQHQNSGIQELYQKLRLSSGNNNYCSESLSPVFLGNNVASSSSSSMCNILEPTSVAGGELGYWNIPTLSWSDLPTTNGAYP